MAAPAGFTQLIATRIQDATGVLCPNGTLQLLPTDANDVPIGTTAGGLGGPIASTLSAPLLITNGVLAATAIATDPSLTRNPNICYRFVFKDLSGNPFLTWTRVQFSGPSFNLDTYTPNNVVQAPYTPGPQGLQGPPGQDAIPTVSFSHTFNNDSAVFLHTLNSTNPVVPCFIASSASGTAYDPPQYLNRKSIRIVSHFSGLAVVSLTYAASVVPEGAPIEANIWQGKEGSGTVFNDTGPAANDALTVVPGSGPLNWGTFSTISGTSAEIDSAILKTAQPNPFATNQPFTLCLWCLFYSADAANLVFSTCGATNAGIALVQAGNKFNLQLNSVNASGGPRISVTTTATIASYALYHLGLTYDGSGTQAGVKFYLNGAPVATTYDADTLAGASIANGNPIAFNDYASFGIQGLGKILSGIRLWQRALAADEIVAQYGQGV